MRRAAASGARALAGTGALLLIMAWPAAAAAQGPRAAITAAPPAETESRDASFEFEASGLAPLSRFECSLDGSEWKQCAPPASYGSLVGGAHEFAVRLVGPLADPTPDTHRWTVLVRTVIAPPPPPPPAVDPPPPPPPVRPNPDRRRDARGCAYGANRVGEVALGRLETAIVCLVDGARQEHGLGRMRRVGSLALAAERHARDMVRRRYFAHRTRSGRRPVDRARRAGYLRGRGAWTVGEVLGWGVGRKSSPVATVDAWLASPGHRHVVLHPGLRDIGVGIARGIPLAGRRDGGTFAALLGRR